MKFTKSEVRLIPVVAIQKVLSPRADEIVKIHATSIDGPAVVKSVEEQKRVIVVDKHGEEIELMTSEVTEIERIWGTTGPDNSAKKGFFRVLLR